MDLLIVTGGFPLRSQSFIETKVVELARRGHSVTVLASSRGDHHLDAGTLPALGGRLRVEYRPDARSGRSLARSVSMMASAVARHPTFSARLAAAVAKRNGLGREFARRLHRGLPFAGRRADVVHFEWITKAAECPEVLDLLPAATIVSCRGSDLRIVAPADARLARELPRVFAGADAVHFVSADLVDEARRYGLEPGKAFVNRPAVDCATFDGRRRNGDLGPVRILSVGRLHWVKGYEYALQAIRMLVDGGHEVRYRIVGAGDADGEAAVRFAVRDLCLDRRVDLVGPRSHLDVREELAGADVLLLSSVSEGLSNAVLEAMAMQVPVVVTDVGGMRELVRDDVEGYVVPSRDPIAMADRLARLVVDPTRRAQMGTAGRQRACVSFPLGGQLEAFERKYHELRAQREI